MDGSLRWKIEIVFGDEMMVSTSSTSSESSVEQEFALFIAIVDVTSGTAMKRIDIDISSKRLITANCPILIGNDLIYVSWLEENLPNSTVFNIMGVPQLT